MLVENPNEAQQTRQKSVYDAEFSPEAATPAQKLASPIKRLLAIFANSLLWLIVYVIGSTVVAEGYIAADENYVLLGFILFVFGFIGLAVGQLIMMMKRSQTIGKYWLGIRVVDQQGKPLDIARYLGREILDYFFSAIGIILISAVMILVRNDRRSLSDLLLNTQVVEAK